MSDQEAKRRNLQSIPYFLATLPVPLNRRCLHGMAQHMLWVPDGDLDQVPDSILLGTRYNNECRIQACQAEVFVAGLDKVLPQVPLYGLRRLPSDRPTRIWFVFSACDVSPQIGVASCSTGQPVCGSVFAQKTWVPHGASSLRWAVLSFEPLQGRAVFYFSGDPQKHVRPLLPQQDYVLSIACNHQDKLRNPSWLRVSYLSEPPSVSRGSDIERLDPDWRLLKVSEEEASNFTWKPTPIRRRLKRFSILEDFVLL